MNANAIHTSRIICPDFDKKFPRVSLSALGVLSQMVNVPELDYCNLSKLYESNPANSPDEIKNAIMELLRQGLVITVGNDIFAVDKHVLTKMKVV